MRECCYTKALKQKYPELRLGYAILGDAEISGLNLGDYLEVKRKETERFIKIRLPVLLQKTQQMADFFKILNAPNYPIKSLLEATAKGRPLKLVSPLVDIVQFTELSNSILMGLHDLDKIEGNIYLDVLEKPQGMESLIGKYISLKEGELIIRDEVKVFASLSKGPDITTKVTEQSKHIIVFAFLYPSGALEEGMQVLNNCCNEISRLTEARIITISEAKIL